MNKKLRLSVIAKSVMRASTTVVAAGTLMSPLSVLASAAPTGIIEASQGPYHFWMVDKVNSTATLKKGDANKNVYFSHVPRTQGDTQTLVVQGTDLHGHYINGSDKGTANIIMTGKANADFIEAGNPGQTTQTHILITNSTLNGAQNNHNYDEKRPGAPVPNKNYLNGAAVYLDRLDKGDLSVGVLNHSTVTGGILAGQKGKKDVLVDNSALKKGGIRFDGPSVNTIAVNHSSIDALGGKGDDKDYAISLSGAKQNTLSITHDSTMNGGIHLTGVGHNDNITITDSTLNALSGTGTSAVDITGARQAQITVARSHLNGDVKVVKADSAHLAFTDTDIKGDMVVDTRKQSSVSLSNSELSGSLKLSGEASPDVIVTHTLVHGDIDARDVAQDMNMLLDDHSVVMGNIMMAKGNDTLELGDNSSVLGDIKGGQGKNRLIIGKGSMLNGDSTDFTEVITRGKGSLLTKNITKQHVVLRDHSYLYTNEIKDALIDTDSSSQFEVAEGGKGHNIVAVSSIAQDTHEGSTVIGRINDNAKASVDVAFANKKHASAARLGAYNVDLSLSEQQVKAAAPGASAAPQGTTEVMLTVKKAGLASDVQGAIAGLAGARQDSAAVTASVAGRMTTLATSSLFNGTREGADVWADYLYQNSDNKAAVNYHNALKGGVVGVDWTSVLNNRDSLTGGIALGETHDKLSNKGSGGDFTNTLKGNFYTLYGGWQQALKNDRWGFFVNGSTSYGEIGYALSSLNAGSTTNGIKEHLNSAYKGKAYNTEMRAGINYRPSQSVVLQPYAVVGWSEATANAFDNAYVHFEGNKNSSWYAGGGARVTGHVNAGKVALMPWVDAGYISEFSNKNTFVANSQSVSSGKSRHYGLLGAGMSAGLTDNLIMDVGAYTGAGDVSKGVSVQAGIKYNF